MIPFNFTVSEKLEGDNYSVFDIECCAEKLKKKYVDLNEFRKEVINLFGEKEVLALTPEEEGKSLIIDILC